MSQSDNPIKPGSLSLFGGLFGTDASTRANEEYQKALREAAQAIAKWEREQPSRELESS